MNQQLSIQQSDEFALWIYSFGTPSLARLAYLGTSACFFHPLGLGEIWCGRTVTYARYCTVGTWTRFTAPVQGHFASARIATPHHAVFGDEFVCSHLVFIRSCIRNKPVAQLGNLNYDRYIRRLNPRHRQVSSGVAAH